MIDIGKLHVDLDVVISKKASLDQLISPGELHQLKLKFEKNHWDDNTIIANVYRYIKDNTLDILDASDLLDSSIIIESDPYVIKAMELMAMSQRHAEVLLLEKESKYPGSWVSTISQAISNLECDSQDFNILVWDAYFMRNFEKNKDVPGWTHLANVLDDYFFSL